MRNGKIARLPHSIREQLNQRLRDRQPSNKILDWLNSLPEARAILAKHFDRRPFIKQNLSEWRQGGFREWLTRQEALDFLGSLQDKHSYGHPDFAQSCSDKLSRWLLLQYAAATHALATLHSDPNAQWARLRDFSADITRLRRSEFYADRLELEREWLALEKSNSQARKENEFWKWTKRPDIHQKLYSKKSSTSLAAFASALGYHDLLPFLQPQRPAPGPTAPPQAPSGSAAPPPPSQTQSNPVKPEKTK